MNLFDTVSGIYNWIKLYKNTVKPDSKHTGKQNSSKFNEAIQKYIVKYFTENLKNNLKKIRISLKCIFNTTITKTSIYTILNNLSYKKGIYFLVAIF